MSKLPVKILITSIVCLLLLGTFFPVFAQDGGEVLPTVDTATLIENPEDTATLPEATETSTITPETSTITPENSITPETITSTETSTATSEVTLTLTSTATPSPTATKTTAPTKTQPKCNQDDVYQYQIVVGYSTPAMPHPSVKYSMIKNSTNEEGGKTSVLQVSKTDFCAALAELQNRQDVEFAEPNYEISLLDTIPNDGLIGNQYYLTNILAPQGWDYDTGSAAVIVAVLDTGVDLTHSELASKLVAGYDYIEKDTVPQDANGHGTHVAGIIAAVTDNGSGIAGISWGAQVMPVRILDAYGNGSYANTAEAIRYAVDHGALVINMSIGGSNYSEVLENAVHYAASHGVVMVAATGNKGSSTVLYPARFGEVIAVGATDHLDQRASFSNTGAGIDVAAPGVSIFSLSPGNSYQTLSGTSMATPMVAGFVALLWSLPEITSSSQLENVVKATAKDLGSRGWDSQYGYGLIQIGPGLKYALGLIPTQTPTTSIPPKHIVSTPTIFYTPTPTKGFNFYIPATTLTYTPMPGSITPSVTPGEISMQEGSPTLGLSDTQTLESNELPDTSASNSEGTNQETGSENNTGILSTPLLVTTGIIYIACGTGLFVFIRKRYFY